MIQQMGRLRLLIKRSLFKDKARRRNRAMNHSTRKPATMKKSWSLLLRVGWHLRKKELSEYLKNTLKRFELIKMQRKDITLIMNFSQSLPMNPS